MLVDVLQTVVSIALLLLLGSAIALGYFVYLAETIREKSETIREKRERYRRGISDYYDTPIQNKEPK
jgi:uncharacterized membrane protein